MALLGHLAADNITQRLARGELPLRVGPYVYNIQTNLPVVAAASKLIYGNDVLASLPIQAYLQTMGARPSFQKIHADRQANMQLLAARIKARG